MRNHRRSSGSSIRASPTHGMDLKTNPGVEVNKGANSVPQNTDHHRFSPGPDMSMLQKSYGHRDNPGVGEEMMGFNQGYDMPPANNLEQNNCNNNDTGVSANRLHPFGPFAPTPPGSGSNNNGSPFCAQSQAVAAAAAAAAGLSQQSQLNNGQTTTAPPSFMDTPPSSFCSAPYNYSLYSMHSQDSRVKMEKEKEVAAAAAAAAYNNKQHSVEDKELAAAKWITS